MRNITSKRSTAIPQGSSVRVQGPRAAALCLGPLGFIARLILERRRLFNLVFLDDTSAVASVTKRRKRYTTDNAVAVPQKDFLCSLRDLINDRSIPAYVKLMVDSLVETKESKRVHQRNDELMYELQKLWEEHSMPKQ
ncbi:unnamed protein product [Heligmosomoides polygyrus]|uniref:Uncharacterized protein n=1 Tax=Heligmosomoides polygyrus TaxID=6339 RepID=A0A183F4P5_HELPZ|nr:unnamed protein product [Heligmosomoides polygyrus]